MAFLFDVFLVLLVCNQATPYFAVGETFGFSSMQEPSWSSSFDDNIIPYEDPNVDDMSRVEESDARVLTTTPRPTTARRPTTTLLATTTSRSTTTPVPTTTPQLTTTLPVFIATTAATTSPPRSHREYPATRHETSGEAEDDRKRPRMEIEGGPNRDDERSQVVNTITVFKNIVRSIQSEMTEIRRTCEQCSEDNSAETAAVICETSNSKTTDSKIKQQLRDLKGSIKSIDATLTILSNTINTIAANMAGVQPRDCMDMFTRGQSSNGIFYIQPKGEDRPFLTYCDMNDGGGWTVIQRRQEEDMNFDRGWGSYRRGFGDPNYSHWMGLDKIHTLLDQDEYELRIDLELYNGRREAAYYEYFKVGNAESHYVLTIGNYNGTAGDALTLHNGLPFTTKDRDNDNARNSNCANNYKGGWWYGDCLYVNLNGLYIGKEETDSSAQGIIWFDLTGFHSSLRYASMAIRPTS